MTRENKVYTFVLDYNGGTYISQVLAVSPELALPGWLAGLRDEDLEEWSITRSELHATISNEHLVPLNGCTGVWCLTGSGRHGLILINVIATETGGPGSSRKRV